MILSLVTFSDCEVEKKFDQSENENIFECKFNLKQRSINDLIAAGMAFYAIEFDCVVTNQRFVVRSQQPNITLRIPKNDWSEELGCRLTSWVCLNEEQTYQPDQYSP